MDYRLEHPVITRLRMFGYEYDEPAPRYCATCGRELSWEDVDAFGNYEDECWECKYGKEDDFEEMED